MQVSTSARTAASAHATSWGSDAVSTVPYSRWSLDEQLQGRSASRARFSAFMADVDAFDAVYFRIPAPEAALMDPQQRLLLEVGPLSPCARC